MMTLPPLNKLKVPDLPAVAKRDLAHLLYLLAYGERMATHCAHWQSLAAGDVSAKRFFNAQCQHERFHAWLFERAAQWLNPGTQPSGQGFSALSAYRERLVAAVRHDRWLEVLVGQQLVLEGIGEVVLKNLDQCMRHHQLGFQRVRKLILQQESAHHAYGLRLLNNEIAAEKTDAVTLSELAAPYLDLADRVITDASPLLENLNVNAATYHRELRSDMPAWVNSDSYDLCDTSGTE